MRRARRRWLARSPRSRLTRACSGSWRHCVPTCRSSATWRPCDGRGRAPSSRRWRGRWTRDAGNLQPAGDRSATPADPRRAADLLVEEPVGAAINSQRVDVARPVTSLAAAGDDVIARLERVGLDARVDQLVAIVEFELP